MKQEELFKELFDLTGKVALVTGGSKGLGREIAEVLAIAGASVAVCSRSKEESEKAAAEIAEVSGSRTFGTNADVSKAGDLDNLISETEKALGPIDIVVASAGINIRKGTEELTEDDWDQILDINLKGSFMLAKKLLPGMKERKWGRILFFGSNQSYISIPGRAAYSSSKSAILGLTRTLALETARDGICVNALCPGPFETPMNIPVTSDPEKKQAFADMMPIGRWGDPKEIRGISLYLCSQACSFMTGSGIVLDGGWIAQ
ncbi:MAG: SDR family NAD(P)-dependent oxidoreductase [Planctomycetota bacterium]|jgi:NAD(P)-dependent dehydrogenase (short-subunit alcohol dehydrogenase family)